MQHERVSDEQTFRDFVEWTANLTDEQLAGYDWWAHRANARNLIDVSAGGMDSGGLLSAWDELVKAADPSV